MDEKTHPTPGRRADTHARKDAYTGRAAAPGTVKRRLRGVLRGSAYGGMAFLLSGCHLLFGTLPLGLALLCASSRYTWYIVAGLMAGTLWGAFEGVGWVWISVYALAMLLRLGILFFVDPPDLAGRQVEAGPTGSSARGSTAKQWASLKAILSEGQPRRMGQGSDRPPEEAWASATSRKRNTEGKLPIEPSPDTAPPTGGFSAAPRACIRRHRRLFNENPLLRIFTGAVCGFAAGLCGIFRGGFAFYDLFGALFLTVTVPLTVGLLIPGFGEAGQALLFAQPAVDAPEERRRRPTGIFHAVSVGLCLAAVIWAARVYVLPLGTPYISLRLAPLLAILLTLGATVSHGLTTGVVTAAVVGVAADPWLAPGLILCALVYAVARRLSVRLAVAGGCVAVLVWCAVPGGMEDVLGHLFTCLVAIPLHLVIERLRVPCSSTALHQTAEMADFTDAAIREAREADRTARLKALSGAFSSLSRLFYDMSDRMRQPRMADLHKTCEGAVRDVCAVCPRRIACRTEYPELPEAMDAHLTVGLRTRRTVSVEVIPPALRAACTSVEIIVAEVNARCGALVEQCRKSEKTEVVAADYHAMAAVLAQVASEASTDGASAGEDYPCDTEAAERILTLLTEQGVRVDGAVVCGKRERHIVVRGERLECLPEEKMAAVKAAMEDICGTHLTDPTFDVNDGRTVMRLSAEPWLEVSFAGSTVPAGTAAEDPLPTPLTHETVPGTYLPPFTCGDHIALFTDERAYFYAVISDGMGSGEEASLTSDICTVFLERMLTGGNRPELALSMLGNFIRQKNTGTGGECSATVDLMELDLFCGDAVFLKNGAAPTYVVRGGTVYKLRSRTMPIGILRDTPPDALRFRTHPGDVVVMVSDGVTHGNDECPWLIDLLSSPLPPSMDALRINILNHAIASGSPDDLTAIAVKVSDK